MNFCIQHGKCLHCCSWKPLISVWGYPQYPKRCTKVLLSTFEIAIFTTHIHYYPLEMHFNFLFFFFFFKPRSTNSFSIKYQAWFTNGRKCWKFLGCFPPFHPNTSRKEVHLNTFHKNMFYHNEKFIFVSSLWHSLVSGESGLMMKFWFICQLRFIQLREDYKSAKLAARLSSLWPSSS